VAGKHNPGSKAVRVKRGGAVDRQRLAQVRQSQRPDRQPPGQRGRLNPPGRDQRPLPAPADNGPDVPEVASA
jgi:hypothetical protein